MTAPVPPTLERKVDWAIKLLRSIPQDSEIELSYSGGKDYDVILELAKMAGIPFRAIYKNTTIDPPGTIAHCKSNGVEIMKPTINFFDLVKMKGAPTRRARFCCAALKEYKVCDRAIQGIRRSESTNRAKRYHEPEICRTYPHKEKARIYLPILEWNDDDVAEFIAERRIKCHPSYYDENGQFQVKRRLGCIGCPMRSDNGIAEFLQYPKFLKRLIMSLQEYLDAHKHAGAYLKFQGNACHVICHNLFSKSYQDYQEKISGGLFPEMAIDPKEFLETYFKIKLDIE